MEEWSSPFDPRGWAFAIAAFVLSAAVARASIAYAQRRNLIDQPGQRRSHTQPTPRGGGIGVVVAALVILTVEVLLFPGEASADLLACAGAVGIVATVGWIDDHGGLAARWRFLGHCAAAAIVLGPHLAGAAAIPGVPLAAVLIVALILVLALVWSINLHNFMDGIDGILACQALFVFVVLAALAGASAAMADAWHLLALGAAVAGFMPFNFPRARIFMGDVGSGALGLLIGIAVLRSASLGGGAFLGGVAACSAFVTDATCNLVSRMLRGRRWYSAHREHLYQWLVRTGMSHARVVGLYMAWNLMVVAPVVVVTASVGGGWNRWPWVAGLYAGGAALWIGGKRWCLQTVKAKPHAAA